jgi:3-dehydroquinate synthase
MVDAAIGGKVAVNHREGKNLIGAFYQPVLVAADAALLQTLPRREFISGWAEVIKHALIMDLELLDWLERDADVLLDLTPRPPSLKGRGSDPAALSPLPFREGGPGGIGHVLRRSIALKAQVVSGDERESGPRLTLNYGHTTGHALEAATGYEALLHGEAVAVGMVAAAHIGRRLSLITAEDEARQNRLIERFSLPLRAPGVDVAAVLGAMSLDKKVSGRQLRWVLLDGPGRTVIRDDVPMELVREAVELVVSPP